MKLSKTSFILPGVYIIGSIGLFIKELSCQGWGCGYVLSIPIMPWPFFINGGGFFDSSIGYFILVALNAIILCSVVCLIEKIIKGFRA